MSSLHIAVQALRRLVFVIAGAWSPFVCAVVLNGSAPSASQHLEAIAASTVLFEGISGGVCTATVVGNRALLTAAHCISDRTTVAALFGGKTYSLRCGPLTGQEQRRFDVALCVSDQQFEGVRSARVEASRSTSVGEPLLMAGYGCTQAGGLDRSGIGRLSVGSARVTGIDVKLTSAPQEAPFVVATGSSPCFGDAGGGVYRMQESTQPIPVLIGLMSRGDLATTSYIVPLAATGLAEALRQAGNEKGAAICGLHDSGPSCGQGIVMQPVQAADRNVQLSAPGIETASKGGLVEGQVVVAAGNGDESVAQAFRRVCGITLEAVLGLKPVNLHVAETTKAKTGEVLKLPPCPPKLAVPQVTKIIQRGDTVWSIWRDLRVATPTAAVMRPGKKEFNIYVKEFNQANPGVELKPNVVVNVPPIARTETNSKAPVVAVTAPPQATPILSLSSTDADKDCKVIAPPAGYPYNLQLLLEILALNRHEDSMPQSPVIILVADSGLQGAGQGIFSNNVLINRIGEDRGEFHKSIVPLVLDPSAFKHGTAVASVALGGPLFARMAVAHGLSRIQLAVQRIYYTPNGNAEALNGVTADVSRFNSLISLAQEQNAAVVNLSLRSTVPIHAIEVSLNDSEARTLFVAAAGNQSKKLSHLPATDTEATYPALYGGSGRSRVITVMALDKNGTRPGFSNWGAEYVDIAAPGCAIPTLEWHAGTGRFVDASASGTSLAAPLVTFAGALIQSESGGRLLARDLKRRLLVSADLAPNKTLVTEVEDGRVLNIAKAAALRVDIVEQMDGPLLAGKINFIEDQVPLAQDGILQFKCKDEQDLRVRRRDLFKIARWIPENNLPRYVVYSRSSSGKLFSRNVCEAALAVKLQLSKPDGELQNINWDQLKDLVMRF